MEELDIRRSGTIYHKGLKRFLKLHDNGRGYLCFSYKGKTGWELSYPFSIPAPNIMAAVASLIHTTEHPILEIKISDPALKTERKKILHGRA